VAALAAGTAIYMADEMYGSDLRSVAYSGGECFLFYYSDVIESVSDSGERKTYTWAEGTFELDEGESMDINAVVSEGERLYAVAIRSEYDEEIPATRVKGAYLYELEFDEETISLGDREKLDWDDMIDSYGEDEYSRNVQMPFIQDGQLIFTTYGYNGSQIMIFDMDSGDCEIVENNDLSSAGAYKDGYVLAALYEYQEADVKSIFAAVDTRTGETRTLLEIPVENYSFPTSPLYVADEDALYYIQNGELWKMTAFEPETAVSICAAKGDSGYSQPILTDDGYIIISSYSSVIKYNTDPDARPSQRLTICEWNEEAVDKAEYQFGQDHADVEVVRFFGMPDIISAMTSQSSDIDIYYSDVSSGDYTSLFNRGYMADMSSSEKLSSLASGLYDEIKTSVVKDGKLYALPLSLYNSVYTCEMEAFERAGLTEDDIPATWKGFFEMLNRLPDILEDKGVTAFDPSATAPNLRAVFADRIIRDYMLYLNETDGNSFDSETLRDIFRALDEVDFEALGVPEEQTKFSFSWSNDEVLFGTYGNVSADNWMGSRPMPLALDDDIPALIPAYMQVLFINPYSKNVDLAMEFMECVADNLDSAFLINAFPGNNEPVISPYAGEEIADREEYIASLKASLETAGEDEKAYIAEEIKLNEEYLDEYRKNGMYIVSADSIALYRSYAEYIRADINNSLIDYTLIQQYADRAIDCDALISGVDQKMRMMIMEGM
ncbi:MAG: ABC transporter substrate-binding protein, partial [Clostridia bacterium]|nr:ABC transporter substrate-binding protein [Clostridia bacterium]